MQEESDIELMRRFKKGEERAFAVLIDRHKNALLTYLVRVVGERSRAEDLAQEAFIKLYLHANRYSEKGKLKSYLFTIATNLALSEHRRARRQAIFRALFSMNHNTPPSSSPQHEVLEQETSKMVAAAIDKLPLATRIPLVLHEIEGLSYTDIAGITTCREGTVKSRINRGRSVLKKRLAPYFNGDSPC